MNHLLKISLIIGLMLIVTGFSDLRTSSDHYDAITTLSSLNIINGYSDGTFEENNTITRAEITKIVIASKFKSVSGENCFSDVSNGWFAPYICTAKNKNMIDGYRDGTFEPFNEVTYAEALKISMNGLGVTVDAENASIWYEPYFETAKENKILDNINTSSPAQKFSRGNAAQLIYNIIKFQDPELEIPKSETPTTTQNTYSWDSSFNPKSSDFPIVGLIDAVYDGKTLTPMLPPGKWDWSDTEHDSANYRNFATNIGTFSALKDSSGNQYGWKLIPKTPGAVDYSGAAEYFYGSAGVDYLNLGKKGSIHSISGNLGDGPDILVFNNSYSLDFRTGSSISGSKHDNDLVLAGICTPTNGTEAKMITSTIHTGPGNDLVFVRDMARSAIDAGNGNGGDTSVLDPNDGNDVVIFHGNMYDFRFFGGKGNDTVVWYPDEVNQSTTWLGPNFFGGGGSGNAIWTDTGSDTLVLAIPTSTQIVSSDTQKGQFMIRADDSDNIWWDDPTVHDQYAKYCITCGISSDGRHTTIMEYNSSDGRVRTGYFYVTSFSRLQIGTGADAKVYDLDQKTGTVNSNATAAKFTPPEIPTEYCED